MSGRLEKPIYQLPMPLDGIDEVLDANERERSENALAALAALRVREPIYADNGEKLQEVGSKDAEPKWMELYRRLREAGWAWRVAVYIAWAAQPKKYRWPETQEELATRCLGLNSDRAIATWRKKNPTIDETVTMLQGSIIFDALPDAMQAMVDVATTANYKGHNDRKLMFEMSGVYVPSSKLTAEMVKRLKKGEGDEREMSTDELREIAALAKGELERREEETPLPSASPQMRESANLEGDDMESIE